MGDFCVRRGPPTVLLTQISSNAVFLKSQNLRNVGTLCNHNSYWFKVPYMSFERFLLAVESRNLSQADKSVMRVSSFSILQNFNF